MFSHYNFLLFLLFLIWSFESYKMLKYQNLLISASLLLEFSGSFLSEFIQGRCYVKKHTPLIIIIVNKEAKSMIAFPERSASDFCPILESSNILCQLAGKLENFYLPACKRCSTSGRVLKVGGSVIVILKNICLQTNWLDPSRSKH